MQHNILRNYFGTFCKFQGLLHHSFDRYYITTKLNLPKEQNDFL